MEPSQKIPILLAEYNALRAEVLAARVNVGQAAGIFAAAITAERLLPLVPVTTRISVPRLISTDIAFRQFRLEECRG